MAELPTTTKPSIHAGSGPIVGELPTTAPEALPEHRSLYDIAGDIKDINTLLVNKADLQAYGDARAQAARMEAMEEARRTIGREILKLTPPLSDEDGAYMAAIDDAQKAIRALGGKGAA